jgi:hypothetical protein
VLLDCALDQVGQVASVAVQVAENEQPAHEPSLTLARPETGDLAAVVRWSFCSAAAGACDDPRQCSNP